MNMCPSNKRKTSPELCLKGQVFFIWSNFQSTEVAKDRISLLGGKIDQFLSRDVTTVLVEDNHLIGPQLLSTDLPIKPSFAANGTVITTFPYPNSLCNVPSTSRGFNFLAASSSNSPYRVICYARQWGIQVWGIDQFLTWIEPQVKSAIHLKKKSSENVSNLTGCFIKFESLYKNYRPCHKMFNNDPDRLLPLKNAKILVKPDSCNVILEKPVGSRQLQFGRMDISDRPVHQVKTPNLPVKANDKKPANNRPKPKEENNYCECCRIHFADLKQHIKSVKHQSFVSNEKNYESIQNIIKMLPTAQEFIEKLQNPSPNPNVTLTNGNTSPSIPMANIPETDYPMPLNLQIRRDNVPEALMPIDLHVEKGNALPMSSVHVKRGEEMPIPLDLHVKKDNEIKIETKDVEDEINIFADMEQTNSYKKIEPDNIQPKIEVPNDVEMENVKIDDKQAVDMPENIHGDEINGDAIFDKTNTAALAQLCLKNFDSYWLDSLPCEMDDMVFDDIFDFDDGKMKLDNEIIDPVGDTFAASDIAHTPGMVSGISTPNLRTQTNASASFYMNSPVDVKDIKSESTNLQESFLPTCKLEKDSLSPENIASSFNEPLLDDKKQIFSIASFCSDKINVEATPSYSNAISTKNQELLFSSESSDDENGNVLISNALNFITNANSDSDMKMDKESGEDNSIQGHYGETFQHKHFGSESKVKEKNNGETAAQKAVSSNVIKIQQEDCSKSTFFTKNPPVSEMKSNTQNSKNFGIDKLISKDVKMDKSYKKSSALIRKYSCTENKAEIPEESFVPTKKLCLNEVNVYRQNQVQNFPAVKAVLSSKMKIDLEHRVEGSVIKNVKSNELNTCKESGVKDSIPVKSSSSVEVIVKEISTPVKNVYSEINKSKEISKEDSLPTQKLSHGEMNMHKDSKEISFSIKNICSGEINICKERKERRSVPIKKDSSKMKMFNESDENNLIPVKDIPCEVNLYEKSHNEHFVTNKESFGGATHKESYNQGLAQVSCSKRKRCVDSNRDLISNENISFETKSHKESNEKGLIPFNRISSFETKISEKSKEKSLLSVEKIASFETKSHKESTEKGLIPFERISSFETKVCEDSNERGLLSIEKVTSLETKTSKDSMEKGFISVKKISLYGTKKSKEINESEGKGSIPAGKVTSCEMKDSQSRVENFVPLEKSCEDIDQVKTPLKKLNSKQDKMNYKKGKSTVKKHCTSKTNVVKHSKEKINITGSANPCQYLNTTEKVSVETSSSKALPTKSSKTIQTVKIPHKKSASKLQKLPPLWSVSILPGSAVRLKFTCIHPEKIETCQSQDRGSFTSP